MTSEIRVGVLALAVLLAACAPQAEVTEGLAASVEARNAKSQRNEAWAGEPVADGESSYQRFYTDANKRIDLQQGLLVLYPVALRECASVAGLLGRSLGLLIPAAHAHVGHAAPPAGVIDVARADATTWDLGAAGAEPGTYCEVDVALGVLPSGSNGAGALLFVAPCYYPDSGSAVVAPGQPFYADEVNHRCYDAVPVPGEPRTVTLELPAPVTLDTAKRQQAVTLTIEYDTWFDGVDVDALGCDPAAEPMPPAPACDAQAKPAAESALIDNVAGSLRLALVEGD